MQDSLASLLGKMFGKPLALKAPLTLFDQTFDRSIKELASQSDEAAEILRYLGLIMLDLAKSK
jgi:hypothetical protein